MVEIGAEAAAKAAWPAQGAAVRLQQRVHAEGAAGRAPRAPQAANTPPAHAATATAPHWHGLWEREGGGGGHTKEERGDEEGGMGMRRRMERARSKTRERRGRMH